ncbi:MAG: OmpA family protein [Myxococcales bacterium]|nr:OmpA family protein [Myxococcales bacterium]MCB9668440.1 OmpA family protein [Alphaproteobacteria bacterium]MCB9690678.1 OmpA family protein [Alphaproteobacteria bacterium]
MRALAAMVVGMGLAGSARAADVQTLQPLGEDFTSLRPATVGDPWSARVFLANDAQFAPLVLRSADGTRTPYVRDLVTARLGASLATGEYLRFGVLLPVHVARYADDTLVGPGDVLLFARIGSPGMPVALVAELERGNASAPQPFSTHAVTGGLTLRTGGLGGQILARVQPDQDVGGTVLGARLEGAVGYGGDLYPGLRGALELFGAFPLGQPVTSRLVPLEALATARGRLRRGIHLRGGVGVGLTDGLGTPASRLLLDLSFVVPGPEDHDGDGRVGPQDRCPRAPEDLDGHQDRDGCPDPDNDGDGLSDVDDVCPNVPETVNGYRDDDGCPDVTAGWRVEVRGPDSWTLRHDGDAFHGLGGEVWTYAGGAGEHAVVVEAEGFVPSGVGAFLLEGRTMRSVVTLEARRIGTLVVRVRGPDGSVVPGVVVEIEGEHVPPEGGEVRMEREVGDVTVRVAAEGFGTHVRTVEVPIDEVAEVDVVLEPDAVHLEGNQLVTTGTPLFAHDRDTLEETGTLDAIAAWMAEHGEVRLLRVEGHADSEGPSAYNYALSVRRAEGVAAALVERGIARDRLQVVGAGEGLAGVGPLRQVTFTVIVRDGD